MRMVLSKKTLFLVIVIISLFQFGCQKSDMTAYEVKLATNDSLGKYLVDKDGYTSILFFQ